MKLVSIPPKKIGKKGYHIIKNMYIKSDPVNLLHKGGQHICASKPKNTNLYLNLTIPACGGVLPNDISTQHPMFLLQRKSHRFCPDAPDLGVIFDQDPLRLTGFIRGIVLGTMPLISSGAPYLVRCL